LLHTASQPTYGRSTATPSEKGTWFAGRDARETFACAVEQLSSEDGFAAQWLFEYNWLRRDRLAVGGRNRLIMTVHVKLFSRFRRHLPTEARGEGDVDLPQGATVAQLLDRLQISGRVQLVSVNGDPEPDRQRVLEEGDSVRIFPFVVGG